jgi:hypothetical protein
MATQIEVAQVVGIISAAYPNFAPSQQTVEVYYQSLHDLNYDELKAATMQSITEAGRKFAPSVGELRGAVVSIRKQITGVPSSYQAWQEVLKQINDNGGDFGKPVWSNPIVKQAVDALGWRNLRMSEDGTADRARFIMAYDQLLQRAENDDIALPAVKGYIEVQSRAQLEMKNVVKRLEAK